MVKFFSFVILIISSCSGYSQELTLNGSWQFRNLKESKWYEARVPGTVHTDLLENKLIPDPFYRDNESTLQWISKADWEYRKVFDIPANIKNNNDLYLVFEGLDTYADIYLNDVLLLSTENMFRTYPINIRKLIKTRQNIIRVRFRSAENKSDSIAAQSILKYPCENNRNFIRKAQYHFGWDWAPRLNTCGIWRNVKLVCGKPDRRSTAKYSAVKLIQEKDSIGQSFYFTVNGKPTFMKGANWIPADVFLPRISAEKYRELLIAAKEAGFNMLRVWGGGIYEDDYFYTLCDSLGIYIWQDFMFAGAMYPLAQGMLENIKQEAIDNILRLRVHPCIVIWCGNNEIDEAWNNWGWQKQFQISTSDSILLWQQYDTLFHQLLPELVKKFDSGRQYIPSSPLHGWGRQQSMTHGDSHYWGLWWGLEPISVLNKKIPRFMSEYGMQAMPVMQSIRQYLLPSDMDTSSKAMKTHQKHPTGYRTLSNYMKMEKLSGSTFISFVNASQELQSRCIETAVNAQLGSGGRCMGSLIWQFNDCWPVCSWSVVDYYGRKKKGYYALKKLYGME